MNYDRRYSPPMANHDYSSRTMNYRDSRSQPITPRGGIDSRAPAYGREYPPLRSRSQTNIDQDYGDRFFQPPVGYDNRGLDKTSRSKSLDNREFRGDDGYYRDDRDQSGVVIPIRREMGRSRPVDVRSSPLTRPRDFEQQFPDDRRQEVHIPFNRDVLPPPRRGGYNQADSPKSYSSRFQDNRRHLDYPEDRGGIAPYGDDFERDDFGHGGGQLQPYRGGGGQSGGGHSAYRASSHHRSHHESYGGGGHDSSFIGGGVGGGGSRGGAIIHQPSHFYPGDPRQPIRPIQHHRVQCCCFKFVWPPWSVEQTPPPQQIYRNI